MNNNCVFKRLANSKFRSSFHLKDKDKKYVLDKGYNTIREHAYDFINKRLAMENIVNDGHQTPMRGHPVFVAQHATATCCRSCLYKWHKIEKNKKLTSKEVDYIVNITIEWIRSEMNK